MCFSVTLLPVPLRPSRQNAVPSCDVERHVVEHLPASNVFVTWSSLIAS